MILWYNIFLSWKNAAKVFVEIVKGKRIKHEEIYKNGPKRIKLTDKEKIDYKTTVVCHTCERQLRYTNLKELEYDQENIDLISNNELKYVCFSKYVESSNSLTIWVYGRDSR